MMMRMKKVSHIEKRSKNIFELYTEISRQIKSRARDLWVSSVGDNNADNVNIMNTKAKTAGMF